MSLQPKRQRKMAHSSVERLVGRFIGNWNLLEEELNDTITTLCKMERLHGAVVTANLNFQTKMHIIRTMVHFLGSKKPAPWIESANDTINKIQGINDNWRTLVAHNIALAVDMTTVRFLKVSAKRKLTFPDTKKTKTEFNQIDSEVLRCMKAIRKIAEDLGTVSTNSLAEAVASSPTQPWTSLANLGHLLPLAPMTQHSPSGIATGGTPYGILANPPPKDGEE
jgi:hypothetical protein